MADCLFCRIVAGELPSWKVYEDEHVLAFLDVMPSAKGHTLVIPKNHAQLLTELPFTDTTHVFSVVRKVDAALREKLGAQAVSILLRDGPAADQEVPHLHVNVIPRFEDDGMHDGLGQSEKADPEDLDSTVERLRI